MEENARRKRTLRGLPYMTSTQKGEVGLGIPQICRQTLKVLRAERGEGVKKCINSVDVL